MNPDNLIEFERREELARAIIPETTAERLGFIPEMDTIESRQAFYKVEYEHMKEYTPNIYTSINTLGEAYGWQEFCAPQNKGYSQKIKEFRLAKARRDTLKNNFVIGGFYGSLAYRSQTGTQGHETADLPLAFRLGSSAGSMAVNYSNAKTIFELLEKDTEDVTFYLSNVISETNITYPSPVKAVKKAVILGAVASYHLCSFADWHNKGTKHEISKQLNDLFIDSIWLEFESYKYSIRRMLALMPSKIRQYKELSKYIDCYGSNVIS